MKIEIINQNFFYDFLENPPIKDDGESWKGESGAMETAKRLASFVFNATTLPRPLNRMGGRICRSGDIYSAFIWVEPQKGYSFEGVSSKIERLIAEAGCTNLAWLKTSEYRTGYFFREGENVPSCVIFPTGKEYSDDRVICIGTAGSKQRKLNREDFGIDLAELSSRAGMFVNACFSKEISKAFDSRVLHLNL